VTILLDTQVWLWMLMDPDRFSAQGRETLIAPDVELLLSAASTWEIAIKHGLGKLHLPGPAEIVIPEMMSATRVVPLPVLHTHTLRVANLPDHHRDPFDRLLVAQAQLEGVPMMTSDVKFSDYEVDVLAP